MLNSVRGPASRSTIGVTIRLTSASQRVGHGAGAGRVSLEARRQPRQEARLAALPEAALAEHPLQGCPVSAAGVGQHVARAGRRGAVDRMQQNGGLQLDPLRGMGEQRPGEERKDLTRAESKDEIGSRDQHVDDQEAGNQVFPHPMHTPSGHAPQYREPVRAGHAIGAGAVRTLPRRGKVVRVSAFVTALPERDRPAICAVALLAAVLLLAPNRPAAAQADSAGHPGDPWFALDHVLDVAIEMAPVDWDRLRHQTQSTAGWKGGSECLAQPFPEVYSWFAADVTVDGQRHGEVGVRKKGFYGSLSTSKPSLKIDFDRFVDDQALGGVLRRINLDNNVQDLSLLNTCLTYHVFAAAGLPAPRCNYARVAVNGQHVGLYVHVEDVKRSLLERAFADAGGNLYEGNFGDFRPGLLGTFEKETNQDAGDWSDVEAVVAALQDPTPAGLKSLAAAADLDRFLTFWAAEVLVGHGDGYVRSNNNFHFYREPGGRFVFIPWGADQTFTQGARSAIEARGAIAHRLYRDAEWRTAYEARLRELLDTVWDETELLRRSERMAAIVQTHVAAGRWRDRAARDADRVRRFIRERRAEIMAALESEPAWEPLSPPSPGCWGEPISFEMRFETTWGRGTADPFSTGAVTRYLLDGTEQAIGPTGVTAGLTVLEPLTPPGGVRNLVVITLTAMGVDSTIHGVTVWLQPHRFVDGARLVIDRHATVRRTEPWLGAANWSVRPGAAWPENIIPFRTATLELYVAARQPGAPVSGRFYGVHWSSQPRAGAPPSPP